MLVGAYWKGSNPCPSRLCCFSFHPYTYDAQICIILSGNKRKSPSVLSVLIFHLSQRIEWSSLPSICVAWSCWSGLFFLPFFKHKSWISCTLLQIERWKCDTGCQRGNLVHTRFCGCRVSTHYDESFGLQVTRTATWCCLCLWPWWTNYFQSQCFCFSFKNCKMVILCLFIGNKWKYVYSTQGTE